jgi:beta-lactam-binding protein with PASTA domain
MKAPRRSWSERLGFGARDFGERREVVERSRSAAWRVPIALIVATLGAGALGYLGVQLFLLPETLAESRLHRVPDLTGMSIDDAIKEGRSAGYEVVASGRQYAGDVDEQDVIYQIPPPDSYLADGDTVFALVSLGPPETRLPELTGLDFESARAVLHQIGVGVAAVERQPSELLPQNVVVSSDPPAGTPVDGDLSVVLRLSRGGTMVEMPDVRGLSQTAARDTLEIFGLTVGEVTSVGGSDSTEAGEHQVVVTGQEPGPKQAIRTGSAVRLQLGLSEAPPAGRAVPAGGRGTPAAVPAGGVPQAGPPVDAAAEETPENERARGRPEAEDETPQIAEPPGEVTIPDPESPEDAPF